MRRKQDSEPVDIIRWAGIWPKGSDLRVGVRLADGRDGLLIATPAAVSADPQGEVRIHYTLLIQGEECGWTPVVPEELQRLIVVKLSGGQGNSVVSFKDLQLF